MSPEVSYFRAGIFARQQSPLPISRDPVIKVSRGSVQPLVSVNETQLFEIVVATVDDIAGGFVGVKTENGETKYCCTEELFSRGLCGNDTQIGHVIIASPEMTSTSPRGGTSKNSRTLQFWEVEIPPGQQTSTFSLDYDVNSTNLYYIFRANCRPGAPKLRVAATWVIANPFGYLGGGDYGYLPFYAGAAACYGVASLIWFLLCLRYWRQLITLQKTLSRVLVLLVAHGLGVVRSSLQGKRRLMAGYCLLYGGVSFTGDMINPQSLVASHYVTVGAASGLYTFFVVASLALDAMWGIWVFVGMGPVMAWLRQHDEPVKRAKYRWFFYCLVAAMALTVLYLAVSILDSVVLPADRRWSLAWMVDIVWQVLYFVPMLVLALIWRPSPANQWLVLSREHPGMDEDEDEAAGSALRNVPPPGGGLLLPFPSPIWGRVFINPAIHIVIDDLLVCAEAVPEGAGGGDRAGAAGAEAGATSPEDELFAKMRFDRPPPGLGTFPALRL
ncbi:putative Protein kinase domain [Paratrimastix pyriformis]|uniref:GOST seven transmembrane domain-containing protein n=1 Tax=Paratrimastix pyriformis TaxID=342808 RepID=A0ABQ8UKM8_9EUKA|nr:putative Protein kinase domain [Paratrimastix pyriformis]